MIKAPSGCRPRGGKSLAGVSRGTLAVLLLAVPAAAGAQGFAGTAAVVHGSASFSNTGSNTGNVQTISIPATSPVTTINWTPTNLPSGGSINFLPAGNTVSYVGAAAATVPYTVLNRIISPSYLTTPVAFYGAVTSTANTRVWFYSPGGLLIGSTASFDVGGLVLTAADPTCQSACGAAGDPNGIFITNTGGTDNFSLAAAAGSTSAITIQPGASIKALNSGQSNYIVAIAPQISQGGSISVAGSAALVAAESATFAVDSHGLFNISVTSGTTVADNTFVNTGSVGGPDAATSGSYQRVYMVAVPKNNAITMAISSGGSIGFPVADAANLDGDEIVLSAGSNIADTGTGNPVVSGRAGSGTASLAVGGGAYTSNTYAVATDAAIVTNPAANITFNSNLSVIAPQATVNAAAGTISVGGDLAVTAANGATKTALVEVASGATLAVGADAAALQVDGQLLETADDNLTGVGGSATLQVSGGALTVAGDALVSANGTYGVAGANNGQNFTTGGTALVSVTGGSLTIGGQLNVSAIADASGANAALSPTANYDNGIYAVAGSASVIASGASASISAGNGIAVHADATSGIAGNGYGGSATGGSALIAAQSGGAIAVGVAGAISASASAYAENAKTLTDSGNGGSSMAGTASVVANSGTISVAGVNGISAYASAIGGSPYASSGNGGNATGGTALIATQGSNASIATNTSGSTGTSESLTYLDADALGGNGAGSSGSGGNAVGGTATLQTTGAAQSITIDRGLQTAIYALATGGAGAGLGGGSATGGSAQLLASGGSIAITNAPLYADASATGGADSSGNGGNATGGTVQFAASGGGSINAAVQTLLSASAAGGTGNGNGGNALGGNIFIALGNNAASFDAAGTAVALDASYIAGISTGGGSTGTAATTGGVLLTDLGTVTLAAATTIANNTPFYVQSGGSIAVPGSITGTGTGAYLHLWSDDLGTGSGTVTLAGAALNLPGNAIAIYYNPAAIGTPTDYSAGVAAGNVTAYQLVDNVTQLQQVGSYLSQDFALGRNIDASATQGWNAGAGFVPIGDAATAFTGNFDGLNHTITNLTIDTPAASDVGLFGAVGAGTGAAIIIRNVGLVGALVTGQDYVGALVGESGVGLADADSLVVSNSWSTGGAVTGASSVGGLAGAILSGPTGALSNVHSDAAVVVTGSGLAGGLVGQTANTPIIDAFATGAVTSTAASAKAIGGLVGAMARGSVSQAYATGAVAAAGVSNGVGGLVGQSNGGMITQAYAVGSVSAGTGSTAVGGLVGKSSGSISESWASSPVAAPGATNVGGFVGLNIGTVTNSYWDSYATGQTAGFGANLGTVTALNSVTSDPAQINSGDYAFNSGSYANFGAGNWVYDNASTRPIGAWEVPTAFFGVATIASAHQVQLIDFNLGGSYLVTQNIDMRGTAGTTDIWGPGGFMPLGLEQEDPPFSGTLEGAGHVLSNLTIAPGAGFSDVGLIQQNTGTISDLGLANVNISSAQASDIGAIAGVNSGQITDSFATGTITLSQDAATNAATGGLVGLNTGGGEDGALGTITRSYATVAISGGNLVGGLVGQNEGVIGESFANGAVSGTQAGGLVGDNADLATVTTAYWDTQSSGQSMACGAGACSGATGLTTAQTLQAASFSGFAIDTQGGQGLPWRQYQGETTPLLEAFLTPITVQPGSLTMQYDAQVPTLGVITYGALAALTFGTPQFAGLTKNAGLSAVTYTGGLYSTQLGYDFVPSTTPGTLDITPAPLALGAVSDARVYNATTSSTGSVTVAGLYGNDSVANATQSFSSPNVMGANGSTLVVNPGYVINDGNGGANYTVTLTNAPGTITPAALAITYTANPVAITYGTTPSALSGTVSGQGLQGSDTLATVTSGTASFTTTATAQSHVGSYPITGSGLSGNSGNYSFSFIQAPGNATALTIDAASLTVDVLADAQSRSYGTANPALTYTETGLVNGDMLTGSLATTATITSNVGVYAITQGTLSAGSNYTLNYTGANLTITPASLTVTYTANPASSIYGTAPGSLSGSVAASGLVLGQTLGSVTSGAAIFTTTAGATSKVGAYAVTGSGLTGSSSNYDLTFAQASGNATALAITPRPITVTANPQQSPVGAPGPAFTYVVTGSAPGITPALVNGDQLTGQLASTATATSPAGTYAIVQGTLSASTNYQLTYVGAILTLVNVTGPIFAVGNLIEANLSDLPDSTTPAGLRAQAQEYAALLASLDGTGLYPAAIAQSLIDDRQVTTTAPVNEPVTSNGNPSLWAPGAP